MRELPDPGDLVIQAGDPVTPDTLNVPSRYADVYRDHYAIAHRVDDFEHAAPLAPQAVAFVRWNGAGGYTIDSGTNIKGVTRNGPGDVTIELAIEPRAQDDWFPIVSLQSTANNKLPYWWEYDDGVARGQRKCRLRFVAGSGADVANTDGNFLFQAFLRERAVGPTGLGTSYQPAGGVAARVCVDGVESADHRQDLLDFCASHRAAWSAEHDEEGRVVLPRGPLAAFQIDRPARYDKDGEVRWQGGALEKVAWAPSAGKSVNVRWTVDHERWWRGVLYSWRIASSVAPLALLGALTVGRAGEDHEIAYTARAPIGSLSTFGGYLADADWDPIVSVGVVITAMS
jgi:hypothetical protein